ncbi:hypothetical protein ACFWHV_34580 [Streptomyces collinus]|uniref:hypothetical protein n=1 Tax=Streptomyces collinus TaxID=42684 RepID=UPI0036657CCB
MELPARAAAAAPHEASSYAVGVGEPPVRVRAGSSRNVLSSYACRRASSAEAPRDQAAVYCSAARDARTRLLDAARFAENAWLVTRHEAACRDMSPRQVAERALPRRTYGLSHLNRVGEVLAATVKDNERIPGCRTVEQPPLLRHFRSELEPVQG